MSNTAEEKNIQNLRRAFLTIKYHSANSNEIKDHLPHAILKPHFESLKKEQIKPSE